MNREQRRLLIGTRDKFRSTFSGRRSAYDGEEYWTYEAEIRAARKLAEKGESAPVSANLLTADHLEVGRGEAWHQLWTLLEDEHWSKDNDSLDGQIVFVKRLLAGERDREIRAKLTYRLQQLESGMSMAEIGRAEVAKFRGKESAAYRAAWKQEAEVDAPARKASRKAKAKAYSAATRERLNRRAPKIKPKLRNAGRSTAAKPARGVRKRSESTSDAPPFRMKYSRISSKDAEQRARPNYNSFKP